MLLCIIRHGRCVLDFVGNVIIVKGQEEQMSRLNFIISQEMCVVYHKIPHAFLMHCASVVSETQLWIHYKASYMTFSLLGLECVYISYVLIF